MDPQYAFCPTCDQDVPLEAPPCPDGHDDCPDRACVSCGAAMVVDPPLTASRRRSDGVLSPAA